MPARSTSKPSPSRILIERVTPVVDCGRYPAKACVGDHVRVSCDVVRDGHEVLRAVIRVKGPGDKAWAEHAMAPTDHHIGGNGHAGTFPADRQGRWAFHVEAWEDALAAWQVEMTRKLDAGQDDLTGELSEGRLLLEQAAARAKGADRKRITDALEHFSLERALDAEVHLAAARFPDRSRATRTAKALEVDVDRLLARAGAWYELFPRSWGGFAGVQTQLPRLAELGFDVLYLPPIHPIGRKNRKGRNNALTAGPNDPGSPWAIGDATGGHDAIAPELGTQEEFRDLVKAARELEIDVALDFAIQCSADHPWLTEHPAWFNRRPDGTLKWAENPPKKYQDIYNVDWDTEDWEALWDALLGVVRHWVAQGVRVFRVDNPHTKALPFWEWLIATVRAEEPDVIFLAEAFTKAAMMRALAKLGFSQSYTYFAWKSSRHELTEYVVELATSGMQDYFRPNFWPNTPDILTEELQHGGPPAFHARLVLAATLGPSYGIYSGYERFENVPVRPGSEEYLDSEKYEARERRLDGPLLPVVGKLNALRRRHPALQRVDTVWFCATENERLMAFVKKLSADAVITVVNLDPFEAQEGIVDVPAALGIAPAFEVHDVLTGERFGWHVGRNYVRLGPGGAHVLELTA